MSYTWAISGMGHAPTLEYDVTDAASAAPMRVSLLTGFVLLKLELSGFMQPQFFEEIQTGFFVPATPSLAAGPDPVIVPEMSLSYVWPFQSGMPVCGVIGIQGQALADPERGGQRGIYLSFRVRGGEYVGLRYRVTLYRPRP